MAVLLDQSVKKLSLLNREMPPNKMKLYQVFYF